MKIYKLISFPNEHMGAQLAKDSIYFKLQRKGITSSAFLETQIKVLICGINH